MKAQCERCKQERECQFYGHPSDVEENTAQNGEWLCDPCVSLCEKELDAAIAQLKNVLGRH